MKLRRVCLKLGKVHEPCSRCRTTGRDAGAGRVEDHPDALEQRGQRELRRTDGYRMVSAYSGSSYESSAFLATGARLRHLMNDKWRRTAAK